jgi:hypothetical protein
MSRSSKSLTHGLAIEPVRGIGLRATIATMAGPSALGPVAMALTAVGAVAIGALAIGRLAIKKAVLEELHASNVEIDTLKVTHSLLSVCRKTAFSQVGHTAAPNGSGLSGRLCSRPTPGSSTPVPASFFHTLDIVGDFDRLDRLQRAISRRDYRIS